MMLSGRPEEGAMGFQPKGVTDEGLCGVPMRWTASMSETFAVLRILSTEGRTMLEIAPSLLLPLTDIAKLRNQIKFGEDTLVAITVILIFY